MHSALAPVYQLRLLARRAMQKSDRAARRAAKSHGLQVEASGPLKPDSPRNRVRPASRRLRFLFLLNFRFCASPAGYLWPADCSRCSWAASASPGRAA